VLASTGSEAVEIALKTALLATGKPGVLAFEGAYQRVS
jgi:4-aminobutyrate aminotransferase-like enzyme